MFQRLQTKNIFPITLLCFAIVFVLALVTKGHGFTDYDFSLITIAAFIFGIFVTFSIINNEDKLNKTNELLKTHDSNFLLLYKLAQQFDKSKAIKCRELIEKHMIEEIDYRLTDFNLSAGTFYELYDFMTSLRAKTDHQLFIYDKMIDVLNDTAKARQQVEVTTRQKISRYEWFSILMLLGIICFLLLSINEGTLATSLLTGLLITPLVVLVLVLQTLNNLRWQENTQIWEPLHRLFLNLDLIPYYPDLVIFDDRHIPEGPGKIRLVHYDNPYPDMSKKSIEIVDIADLKK